jgi:4-hydroxythreonine-4-phosphate dehydrogenase
MPQVTRPLAVKPLAVTMGEPAGVGGEIVLAAWASLRASGSSFFVIDDIERLRRLAERISLAVPLMPIRSPDEAIAVFPNALPVLAVGGSVDATPGRLDAVHADTVVRSIEMAVGFARAGSASGIVTNPIQKSTLYDAGFKYPGHTEFLGALAGKGHAPVMMLACPQLRVVPVTVHQSLASAVADLSTAAIIDQATITADALRRDFGIVSPRLAVAGLNPHAGEGGAMGTEEARIIQPAIDALRALGLSVAGPLPPDTMFTPRARPTYDVAICMYHDQALIPLKALDIDGGVNVTLGLEIVRTSPDHGTALDIAGTGKAHPGSLIAALEMAAEIAGRRNFYA